MKKIFKTKVHQSLLQCLEFWTWNFSGTNKRLSSQGDFQRNQSELDRTKFQNPEVIVCSKKWKKKNYQFLNMYLSFLQILIMVKNNDENFSLKVYLDLIWDSKATNWSNFNEIKIEVFRWLLCPLELVSPT